MARQVALALHRQLSGLKEKYALKEEMAKLAETNFAAIRDGHKRYRVSSTGYTQ